MPETQGSSKARFHSILVLARRVIHSSTWPIFISILPLTLVLHVHEISGNWNESWIGIGYRPPCEQPYFLYIDLYIIFFTTQKKKKWLPSYRTPFLNGEGEWTTGLKFSRSDVYFQKGNWTQGAIDGCCPSASKNDQTTPFSLTDPRSPRSRRNIPRLHPIPR